MGSPLRGRVGVVVGAGRGIGKTIALALADAGADVAVVARTDAELRETADAIRRLGRRSYCAVADVSSPQEAKRAVASCAEELGAPEILVHAAAVQGPIGRFDQNPLEDWTRAIQIDLLGTAYVAHAALEYMVPARKGKIINLSGGGAAGPRPHFSAYASAKAALVRFTETLAEEVRELGIQVNAMAPGATRTRMTEDVLSAGALAGSSALAEAEAVWQSGGADPKKQAALAVFLASDDSDHVTGRLIHVNDPWEDLRAGVAPPDDLYKLRRVSPAKIEV